MQFSNVVMNNKAAMPYCILDQINDLILVIV